MWLIARAVEVFLFVLLLVYIALVPIDACSVFTLGIVQEAWGMLEW